MTVEILQSLLTTTGPMGLFALVVWRTMDANGRAHTAALTSLERRIDALGERMAVLVDRVSRDLSS